MANRKYLIYPIIFAAVLTPVFIVALLTYQPGSDNADCNSSPSTALAAHSHGYGLTTDVQNDMQLIFTVVPGKQLYEVVDGKLQVCGGLVEGDAADQMRHITVDVIDTRFVPGERLPVNVDLEIREADSSQVIVRAAAPAMYAPGHGYHFGDNYLVPSGSSYAWTATISPVQALRQAGAESLWLEPITWSGEFRIDEDGTIIGAAPALQPLLDVSVSGVHLVVSDSAPVPLYDVAGGEVTALETPANSRYFVVDLSDHSVNYEEKLPGAEVTVTFERDGESFDVPMPPVISPSYGFHYGANVALEPGTWQITVNVSDLNFWRHAGAAVSLGRAPINETFTYEMIAAPEDTPAASTAGATAAR